MMQWISVPGFLQDFVDQLRWRRRTSTLAGTLLALIVLFVFRKFFVQPVVAWLMLIGSFTFMGLSMTDPEFAAIVTKPDNVPIVGMVFLLGFFTWLATYRAVQNDDRLEQGLEPLEKLDDEKILVWPDLVYTEMICMVALTALLILWAIGLQAPLEEAASSVKTPNPSKAPWYFLGLQEMLVYFDPWMAGVVLPSLVVVGLMAIPFLDYNKEGNGYYTINQRKFAYLIFQFGFLELWVTLDHSGDFLARAELELLWSLRNLGYAQSRSAQQRRLVAVFLGPLAGSRSAARAGGRQCIQSIHVHSLARIARDPGHGWLFCSIAAGAGAVRVPEDVRQNGLHPLHGHEQFAAVHGLVADQNDLALDLQPEVHH